MTFFLQVYNNAWKKFDCSTIFWVHNSLRKFQFNQLHFNRVLAFDNPYDITDKRTAKVCVSAYVSEALLYDFFSSHCAESWHILLSLISEAAVDLYNLEKFSNFSRVTQHWRLSIVQSFVMLYKTHSSKMWKVKSEGRPPKSQSPHNKELWVSSDLSGRADEEVLACSSPKFRKKTI